MMQGPQLQALIDILSPDRFARYRAACNGNDEQAMRLYEWNATICAAFYFPLQAVEIGLRNCCHRELSAEFGPGWPHEHRFRVIDETLTEMVDKEIRNFSGPQPMAVPKLASELSFGFWTSLFSPHLLASIWTPAIHRAFSGHISLHGSPVRREDAASLFRDIRRFRNRVFHHEAIYAHNLQLDLQRLLDAAAWLSPELHSWTVNNSTRCSSLIRLGAPPP